MHQHCVVWPFYFSPFVSPMAVSFMPWVRTLVFCLLLSIFFPSCVSVFSWITLFQQQHPRELSPSVNVIVIIVSIISSLYKSTKKSTPLGKYGPLDRGLCPESVNESRIWLLWVRLLLSSARRNQLYLSAVYSFSSLRSRSISLCTCYAAPIFRVLVTALDIKSIRTFLAFVFCPIA